VRQVLRACILRGRLFGYLGAKGTEGCNDMICLWRSEPVPARHFSVLRPPSSVWVKLGSL